MKKLFLLLTVLAFLTAGCNFFDSKDKLNTKEPQTKKAEQNQQNESDKQQATKSYIIGSQAPVKGLKDWVQKYSLYEGVFLQKIDDYNVILVSMGEKLTGGYDVKVNEVTKEDNKWIIKTTLTEPKEPDFTTQQITYPNEVISMVNDGSPIEVRDQQTGKNLELIEIPVGKELATSKSFIVTSPLAGETIKSPVTIKGKARVFEANFRIHIEDGHKYLAEKIVTADEGAPEWGNFELNLPFEKPTSPNGSIILSVENMENGKLIEELNIPVKFD